MTLGGFACLMLTLERDYWMHDSDKQHFIFRRKYSCKNASCSKLKYWLESWQSVSLSAIRGTLLPLLWKDKIYKGNVQRKIILPQSTSWNLMRGDDYFIYRYFHSAHQWSNQDALEVQTVVAVTGWCVNNYISVHCRPAPVGVRKQLIEICVWINVALEAWGQVILMKFCVFLCLGLAGEIWPLKLLNEHLVLK